MSRRPARMTANVRLQPPDWCHFTQRLPRSRAHKQLKGAELPFEDERFAYVALTRAPVAQHPARVLAQPVVSKVEVTAKLCTPDGLVIAKVPRRAKADYAQRPALALGRCGDRSRRSRRRPQDASALAHDDGRASSHRDFDRGSRLHRVRDTT